MSNASRRRKALMDRPDVKEMVRTGWVMDRRAGTNHVKFRHPKCSEAITVSPSAEPRAWRNGLTVVRRLNRQMAP